MRPDAVVRLPSKDLSVYSGLNRRHRQKQRGIVLETILLDLGPEVTIVDVRENEGSFKENRVAIGKSSSDSFSDVGGFLETGLECVEAQARGHLKGDVDTALAVLHD